MSSWRGGGVGRGHDPHGIALFASFATSDLAPSAVPGSVEEPPSCTETALLVGAVSATAGLLLAAWIDSWFTRESGSASYYLFAGGTMFVGGGAYAAVRCALERE